MPGAATTPSPPPRPTQLDLGQASAALHPAKAALRSASSEKEREELDLRKTEWHIVFLLSEMTHVCVHSDIQKIPSWHDPAFPGSSHQINNSGLWFQFLLTASRKALQCCQSFECVRKWSLSVLSASISSFRLQSKLVFLLILWLVSCSSVCRWTVVFLSAHSSWGWLSGTASVPCQSTADECICIRLFIINGSVFSSRAHSQIQTKCM